MKKSNTVDSNKEKQINRLIEIVRNSKPIKITDLLKDSDYYIGVDSADGFDKTSKTVFKKHPDGTVEVITNKVNENDK